MAVTSVRSISLLGLTGTLVDIEIDISDGLPVYTLLGLPDSALIESKDRQDSMLAFTTIMMITIISAVIISALRPIRPPTASTNLIGSVREFIKNLSNSISKAFSPLEYNDKGEELKIYTDTMKKSRRFVTAVSYNTAS